ncbi:MAG TPA: hypothetical protein VJT84_03260 [Gaiellaceae bacterium]|nr:hypothetical protein [Gaiellaceae bacterium]
MNRLVVGAALTALVACLAACGGGGGSALTAEEFGKQLNKICADYDASVKKIGEPGSLEELGTKGPQLRDEFDKAIAKAEDLQPPAELAKLHDQFVAKGKELSGLIGGLIDAAEKNDVGKIQELGTKAETIGNESDDLGKKLGAPACAQGD